MTKDDAAGADSREIGAELERIADVYLNRSPAHQVDAKALTLDMEKLLPWVDGPKVLELGAGDGMWTARLIERFDRTHLVDGSAKLLGQARQLHGPRVETFHSLFEAFTPPPGLRFNTIVAAHVLEHVREPVALLVRTRDWLAPNGKVLIVVPNAASLHRRLAVLMGIQRTVYDLSPRDVEVGHQRVYDLPALRQDVLRAGYDILVERGLFLKTLPNALMTGFSDDLLKAMVDISDELPTPWMANLALLVRPGASR